MSSTTNSADMDYLSLVLIFCCLLVLIPSPSSSTTERMRVVFASCSSFQHSFLDGSPVTRPAFWPWPHLLIYALITWPALCLWTLHLLIPCLPAVDCACQPFGLMNIVNKVLNCASLDLHCYWVHYHICYIDIRVYISLFLCMRVLQNPW